MTKRESVYIVVQDPTLVIRTSHECLGLLLRCNIEGLTVNSLEATFDECILLLLCFKNTLV